MEFEINNFRFMEPEKEAELQEKLAKIKKETIKLIIKLPRNCPDNTYAFLKRISSTRSGQEMLNNFRKVKYESTFLVDTDIMRLSLAFFGNNVFIKIYAEFESSYNLKHAMEAYNVDNRVHVSIGTLTIDSQADLLQLASNEKLIVTALKLKLNEHFDNITPVCESIEKALNNWKLQSLIIDKPREMNHWDFSDLLNIDPGLKIFEMDSSFYEITAE